MTIEQYRHIFTAVRSYQKKHMDDKKLYSELNTLLNELEPLAYPPYHYRYSD